MRDIENQLRKIVSARLKTMSLRDLESETGVSFTTLHHWHKRPIRSRGFDVLRRAAEAFGYEISMTPKRADPLAGLPARMRPTPSSTESE